MRKNQSAHRTNETSSVQSVTFTDRQRDRVNETDNAEMVMLTRKTNNLMIHIHWNKRPCNHSNLLQLISFILFSSLLFYGEAIFPFQLQTLSFCDY